MTTAEVAKPAGPAQALALVRALRVHQWVKNLLVFVPVVLDHKLFSADTMAKSATAFAAFCCAASSAYILNDLLDLEADRRHPTKRHRPFAAGTLSPALGHGPRARSCSASPSRSACTRCRASFVELLAIYVVLTTAYSLYLKQMAVVDVLLLAGLYTLRVLAGIAAAQVRFSTWLLAFSMFLFLSLAFLKRFTEVSAMEGAVTEQVRAPRLHPGRPRMARLHGERERLPVGPRARALHQQRAGDGALPHAAAALARLPAAALLDQPHVAAGPSRPDPRRPDRRHGAGSGELRRSAPSSRSCCTWRSDGGAVIGRIRPYRSWGRYPARRARPTCSRSSGAPTPPPFERLRRTGPAVRLRAQLRRQLPQRRRRCCSTCAGSTG